MPTLNSRYAGSDDLASAEKPWRVSVVTAPGGARHNALLGFAAIALVSATVSAISFLGAVHRALGEFSHATTAQREHVAIVGAGLHAETWDFVRANVTRSDRYVIATPARLGAGFHRFMRTVAGYWLLPAVAVSRAAEGDVVVYFGQHGPRGSTCREKPDLVCVHRVRR
jgi:hypothetical protein